MMDDNYKKRIVEPYMELYESVLRRKNTDKNASELLDKKRNIFCEQAKLIIPRITLVISVKCSLRCKDCVNLMQYYNEPYDLGIEELMSEMNEFFDLVDELMEISIVGGEPFLYEDLDKLIQYLISNEKINSIRFTTNGTVVPKESVLNLMSHKKFLFKSVIMEMCGY